ncbi:SdpA family antimicrobial peptide system protein [Nonomuraea insulae]|uniref:SdpA family antimicrobial peptide system protein n=1 Tax=Nonomuraea insulae TaxID=1616787 RepID=A0ABW1CHQ0_9ACTN
MGFEFRKDERADDGSDTASPSHVLEPLLAGAPAREDVRLGRAFLLMAAVTTIFVTYVLHAALPQTVLRLPFENREVARQIVPEGWAFFTSSPRTVYPQAYERYSGTWRARGGSLVIPSGLFGLNRAQRAEGTEMALLVYGLPKDAWSPCASQPAKCLDETPVSVTIRNTSNLRHVCGDIGIVNQEVLPWAWRRSDTIMPSTVVRAEVRC